MSFFKYHLMNTNNECAPRTHAHCLHVYNKVKYQEKYDKYRKKC